MKGKRYFYKPEKKQDYSKLFNDEDKAQLLYFRDAEFRKYVDKNTDDTQTISFGDLYRAYQWGGVQLSLF